MLNQNAFEEDSIRLWMATGRKKLTRASPPRSVLPGEICKRHGLFTSPAHLPSYSIKEPGIQTPISWLLGDISLPYSGSAGFPNEVVFLASAPRLWFIGLL